MISKKTTFVLFFILFIFSAYCYKSYRLYVQLSLTEKAVLMVSGCYMKSSFLLCVPSVFVYKNIIEKSDEELIKVWEDENINIVNFFSIVFGQDMSLGDEKKIYRVFERLSLAGVNFSKKTKNCSIFDYAIFYRSTNAINFIKEKISKDLIKDNNCSLHKLNNNSEQQGTD